MLDSTVRISRPEEGEQDWQLLATEGHVRGHRLARMGRLLFLPCLFSGIVGVGIAISALTGQGGSSFMLPESARAWLVPDPNTYAEIPGRPDEGRIPYTFAWIAAATGSPQRGLTAEAWERLLEAASRDVRANGDDVDKYDAIREARGIDPKLTRPERALAEFRGDLSRGIVAVPRTEGNREMFNNQPVIGYVTAWVEGSFSFAMILGPVREDMRRFAREVGPCVVQWPTEGNPCARANIGNFFDRLRPGQGGPSNAVR